MKFIYILITVGVGVGLFYFIGIEVVTICDERDETQTVWKLYAVWGAKEDEFGKYATWHDSRGRCIEEHEEVRLFFQNPFECRVVSSSLTPTGSYIHREGICL